MKLYKNLIHAGKHFLFAGVVLAASLWGSVAQAAPADEYGVELAEYDMQESIRVLDIEPTRFSLVTEDKVREWIGETTSTSLLFDVEIDQMTLSEFIGKNVDLMETYDLIYIGSYDGPTGGTGKLNTIDNEGPFYNDTTLNGAIYYDLGDSVNVDASISEGEGDVRYSGRDLTMTKMMELKEFVDSGYPLVISSGLYSGNAISLKAVTEKSVMYTFLNAYTGASAKDNVIKEGTKKAELNELVSIPKPELQMIWKPKEYSMTYVEDSHDMVIDEVQFVELNEDTGNYELDYTFEFSDLARTNDSGCTYEVQLFIDTNANGKYEATEEMYGLQVVDMDGRTFDAGAVEPNKRYTVTKSLSADYEGYIPWKLRIAVFDADGYEMSPRCSTTGQCFIPPLKRTEINVLQLTSVDGGNDLSQNETVQYLLDDLRTNQKHNCDVRITTVSQDEYFGASMNLELYPDTLTFYNKYFADYDMLILGFSDDYAEAWGKLEADDKGAVLRCTKAIELFTQSGRAVMFSNDTASYKKDNGWTEFLSDAVKNSAGMDGLNNMFLDANASIDEEYPYYSFEYNAENLAEPAGHISQVNKGQITSYPYDLNIIDGNGRLGRDDILGGWGDLLDDVIPDFQTRILATQEIQSTTVQPYQLGATALENGATVWYCLTDSMGGANFVTDNAYGAMPNDVRNNYYIYSYGNVTYTGMGYSNEMSTYEAKLFVNTLLAAYNVGVKNPKVSIVESVTDKEKELEYIYRMYDETTGEYIGSDETININFYVEDLNVFNGVKQIEFSYYFIRDHIYDDQGNISSPVAFEQKAYVGTGSIVNGFFTLELEADWLEGLLNGAKEVEIFIGAKTTMYYTDENGDIVVNEDGSLTGTDGKMYVETEEFFDSVTIKKVGLFDLD